MIFPLIKDCVKNTSLFNTIIFINVYIPLLMKLDKKIFKVYNIFIKIN